VTRQVTYNPQTMAIARRLAERTIDSHLSADAIVSLGRAGQTTSE
jgi:hypothetical protein